MRLRARLAIGVAALLMAAGARGEILNEADVRAEGNDAVVRVQFGVRVQYLAHAPLGTSDLVDIYFLIVSNNAQQTDVEEFRKLSGRGAFPAVTVTYPVQVTQTTKRIRVRFSHPVKFRVRPSGSLAIEIVIADAAPDLVSGPSAPPPSAKPAPAPAPAPGPAPAAAPVPAPAPTPARAEQFGLTLQTFPTADMSGVRPVPSQFQDYTVFSSQTVREGKPEYELNLGYFATREAAEQARRTLLSRFPDAHVIDFAQRREETLRAAAEAAAKAQPPKPAPPAVAAPAVPGTDIDKQAAALMTKGREALSAGDNAAATELFNQLLVLPPNRYSQEAQELVGLARERNGELAKAKAEYELYLRLFPDGEGAQRVRERLAKVEQTLAAAPPGAAPVLAERPAPRTFTGGLSQYYYGGASRTQAAFNTPTNPATAALTTVDVSQLITNIDLNARYRTSESDMRLVVRDTDTWSFLDTVGSFNRLNAAYAEYRGLQNPFAARLGRQIGLIGGLPARFDGALGGFALSPKWRINAVAGSPVEYPTIDSRRIFYSGAIEFESLADSWFGDIYGINQQVDGILDRRAVGGEVRYVAGGTSLYSLVDYDVSYKTFNITMLQGTFQTVGQTVVNVLFDRRKAPTLTTTNAVLGQPTTSVSTLLQTMTVDQLRQQARDITATATQGLLGFTTPINPTWQVGADVRVTNVGALPATVINNIPVPAQPATGNIWSYALQANGNKLYSNSDINVMSVTLLNGPTFHGQLYSYNNVSALAQNWTLEPALSYYTQKDNMDVRLSRLTPSLKLTYRWRPNVAFETQYTVEQSRASGPTQQENTLRQFWYAGYRFDL